MKKFEKKKLMFVKEEKKRDMIVYHQHLKHLYKIEQRENRFPTYDIKFKSQEKLSPVVNIREEIKKNKLLLNQKPIKFKIDSKEFLEQVNLIRTIERERLKKSNDKLKSLMHNLKNANSHRSSSSFSLSNKQTENQKHIPKMHSLPYMRFANPYYG